MRCSSRRSSTRAEGRPELAISRADHLRLAGLSILGIALNQTLFLLGLRWTTPFSVSLLGATIPVFAAALAVLFGKERLSWRTAIGHRARDRRACSRSSVIGSLDRGAILVALNSLSYAAYVVLSRDVVLRVGALRSVAWIFTYAAILFAPLGMRPMLAHVAGADAARVGASSLYILAMPTIVAYLAERVGARRARARRS